MALKILIRCGFRPGSEFAALTARHVEKTDRGLVVTFAAHEHKTGSKTEKPRKVYINRETAAEVVEIIERAIELHPTGALFRNTYGNCWNRNSLSNTFRLTKQRAKTAGVKFDSSICLYSCRHEFAKRCLTGYYTGKPTTIEILAKLMGNTPQVAQHYADHWETQYTEPLWGAC